MANIDLKKIYDTDPAKAQTLADLLGLDLQTELDKESKKRQGQKLPKVLKPRQVDKLLSVINPNTITGVRQAAIIGVMLKAALRVSEVCNITVPDVDLIKGDLYVQQGKGKKDRHVPIGAELMEWLKDWDAIRPDSEYFFCTLQGTQSNRWGIYDLVERAGNKAGIKIQDGGESKNLHPHVLRHTCATNWLNSGELSVRDIQELLGHKRLETTMNYTHVDNVELDRKIKKLG